MINFKEKIKELILEISNDIGDIQVVRPPKEEMGDFCVPCFNLNIEGLNNPHEKAEYLKDKIKLDEKLISDMSVIGPYLNFKVNKSAMAETTINEILSKKEKYGSSEEGVGKDLLIEHTSINPNASPHIGRTRNSLIGDFLVNLFTFQGYKVEKHYLINDIGKQIAMLLIGVEEKTDDLSNVTFNDMLSIYIDINQKAKEDPSIEQKAFNYLNKLESGDKEVIQKFKQLTDICVEGQKAIFDKMNISWDVFTHESDFVYEKTTEVVLDKLKKLGKLKEDENKRYYVDLSGYNIPTKNPVLVLTREDKTSLYPLRDIAYTLYKEELNSENNYIVLGEDQEVYMKQIAAVMDIMGYNAPKLVSYTSSKPIILSALTSLPIAFSPFGRLNLSPTAILTAGAIWATTLTLGSSIAFQTSVTLVLTDIAAVGQTTAHWPHPTQSVSAISLPNAGDICIFDPLWAKSIAPIA